jgi:hypothetical protein
MPPPPVPNNGHIDAPKSEDDEVVTIPSAPANGLHSSGLRRAGLDDLECVTVGHTYGTCSRCP